MILVVKKNKTRLERLIAWMQGRVPDHVPVLVIDDEADQASVNTGGNRSAREEVDLVAQTDFEGDELAEDELDPSTINLNIRTLLRQLQPLLLRRLHGHAVRERAHRPVRIRLAGRQRPLPQPLHHLAPPAARRQLCRAGAAVRA